MRIINKKQTIIINGNELIIKHTKKIIMTLPLFIAKNLILIKSINIYSRHKTIIFFILLRDSIMGKYNNYRELLNINNI